MVLQRHFWSLLKRRDYLLLNNNLEVSVLNLSEVKKNSEMRIDSDFFLKEYLQLDSILEKAIIIEDIVQLADVTSNGSFKAVSDILNDTYPKDVPYIRSGNVGNTFLNTNELTKISRVAHGRLVASQTKLHDVMMARKGKIGGASIITENEVGFNCNENVVKLTLLSDDFNPFYFTAFFNSKYGLKQVERFSTGNVQPWLSMFQIRKLKIPKLSKKFQVEIEKIIKEALSYKISSDENYNCAEKMLLDRLEFSLEDEKFVGKQLAIKKFKEIQTFNRFDAEYYQPFYDYIENSIKNNYYGKSIIENGIEIIDSSFIPEQKKVYKYVELSNIGSYGEITGFTESIGADLPSRARRILKKDDVIVSSIEGSLESCAIVTEEFDGALCSTGFYVLRSKIISPYFLLALFKSKMMQLLLKKRCSGTILTSINKADFMTLLIPEIGKEQEEHISIMFKQTLELRAKSNLILEYCKRAIEIAIEEGEEKACAYINENLYMP